MSATQDYTAIVALNRIAARWWAPGCAWIAKRAIADMVRQRMGIAQIHEAAAFMTYPTCETCSHFIGDDGEHCGHPKALKYRIHTHPRADEFAYCVNARSGGFCGKKGIGWTPK